MKKLDLKKQLKHLYFPSAKEIQILRIPRMKFAAIDGAIEEGEAPGTSPVFAEDMQALYGVAYTLKFMLKKRKKDPVDYPVMALEGLWWVRGGKFIITKKDNWLFTMMVMQPDIITSSLFVEAVNELRRKRGDNPALDRLRLEAFSEGLCIQTMHIGPYATEPDTVARMQAFADENGYRDCVGLGGKHHEIYLGDPRRADPAKLKTVLRHPVEKIRP